MPKLDNKTARQVKNAEGSAIVLVDEDEYVLKLDKVVVSDKLDKNNNTYWVWTWTIQSGQTTGDKFKGKSLRCTTGFSENQLWFAKMVFEAFEAPANVDTDTLLGKEVKALVGQREIQGGARKGQLTNDISALYPVSGDGDDDEWDDDSKDDKDAGSADDADDDPDF